MTYTPTQLSYNPAIPAEILALVISEPILHTATCLVLASSFRKKVGDLGGRSAPGLGGVSVLDMDGLGRLNQLCNSTKRIAVSSLA